MYGAGWLAGEASWGVLCGSGHRPLKLPLAFECVQATWGTASRPSAAVMRVGVIPLCRWEVAGRPQVLSCR